MLNVIMPMSGLGSRFSQAGFKMPKPFIEVEGHPMFMQAIQCLPMRYVTDIAAVTPKELSYLGRNYAGLIYDTYARIWNWPRIELGVEMTPLEGAANSVLLASRMLPRRAESLPVVVSNCDQQWSLVDKNLMLPTLRRLVAGEIAGAIPVFDHGGTDPLKWSYAKGTDQSVYEVIEKPSEVPTDGKATVGVYFFHRLDSMRQAIQNMMEANDRTGPNQEFYMAPVYNHYLKLFPHLPVVRLESNMTGLGTPEDIDKAYGPDWRSYN